jgi:hypothetical protein
MKTIISFILLSALTISGLSASIAGAESTLPLNQHYYIATADTLEIRDGMRANLPQPAEEEYINDIPFDTKEVSSGYLSTNLPKPAQEKSVNDFPFDTKTLSDRFLHKILPEFAPEEEGYVKDIPFNTSFIANCFLHCENFPLCKQKKSEKVSLTEN